MLSEWPRAWDGDDAEKCVALKPEWAKAHLRHAGALSGLSAMLQLPVPHVTVLSKSDTIPDEATLESFLDQGSAALFVRDRNADRARMQERLMLSALARQRLIDTSSREDDRDEYTPASDPTAHLSSPMGPSAQTLSPLDSSSMPKRMTWNMEFSEMVETETVQKKKMLPPFVRPH
mgnify:CR=1 FL=1